MEYEIKRFLEDKPGSKAKAIVKIAPGTKTEINSLLHSQKAIFYQDEKYRWFLVEEQPLVIEFEKVRWMTARNGEAAIFTFRQAVKI